MKKNEMVANQQSAAMQVSGGGALSVFSDAQSFNTALRMSQCLASSTVVPKEYQGNVGNCMIAIEMASRINTSPMMVMQNTKPSRSQPNPVQMPPRRIQMMLPTTRMRRSFRLSHIAVYSHHAGRS